MIELTVPIEAEATASPVAITTSELTPGTPAGLQLSASSQSELTAPVHVDLLMMLSLTLIAMPALGAAKVFAAHRNVAEEQEPSHETPIIIMARAWESAWEPAWESARNLHEM